MPVDSSIFTDVSDGDIISAEDIREKFSELERFVNGGITNSDFDEKQSNIFSNQHIVKPEFYSVANRRVEGTIADVYYRNTFFSAYNRHVRHETSGKFESEIVTLNALKDLPFNAWQPIDGMASSVFVKGNQDVTAMVSGSMYVQALGSNDGFTIPLTTISKNLVGVLKPEDGDQALTQRAAFERAIASGIYIGATVLYVDKMDGNGPEPQEFTRRRIFNRGEDSYRFRNQQISFCSKVTLSPGINKVSYRIIYRLKDPDSISLKHLVVDGRNFFVDVHYK